MSTSHYETPESTERYARQMDFQIAEYHGENMQLREALTELLHALDEGEMSDEYEAVDKAENLLAKLREGDN